MKFPMRLRDIVHRVRGRLGPRCIIMLYHRVADAPSDPYGLCVSPRHFEEQIQALREVGTPMRLAELVRLMRENHLPERAVCVTFDDGYQDNLYTARPILERHDVPATVFMTTGSVGRLREFWWDELERIFLEPLSLPSTLDLEIGGKTLNFQLSSSQNANGDHRGEQAWIVTDPNPPSQRHAVFQAIYPLLRSMRMEEQTDVLDRLLQWAGLAQSVRETHRALEADEVRALAAESLVEIGGHTVTHPALSVLSQRLQRAEISQCKSTLEQWLGQPVSSFAYPYGIYSDTTVDEVARTGYEFACACLGRAVRRDSEHFLLPRVDAPDVNGEGFARMLDTYFRN